MAQEIGVWRIDGVEPTRLGEAQMDRESRLQAMLVQDISIANPDWLVIGQEVPTDYGGRIDILALDSSANLVVLELKRDETPRNIVAQVLDYGSWVSRLTPGRVRGIYQRHCEQQLAARASLPDAFSEKFRVAMPDEHAEHKLVIVAASLDPATERIIDYLSDYGIPINVLFFQMLTDGERQYLARTWVRDPDAEPSSTIRRGDGLWDGQYYMSFDEEGGHRRWEDAKRYGFISAGGGDRYTGMLRQLQEDDRVWVNLIGADGGYVGLARVVDEAVPAREFRVNDGKGQERALVDILKETGETPSMLIPEMEEYVVKVEWIKSVDQEESVWRQGFYYARHVVARPRATNWATTLKTLRGEWEIGD